MKGGRRNGNGDGHADRWEEARIALYWALITERARVLSTVVAASGWTWEAAREAVTIADGLLETMGPGDVQIHRWERWTRSS